VSKKKKSSRSSQRWARIVEEGTKVWAPIGRRGDGEWDGRHQVIAIFLEPGEAEGYVAAKVATGLPAYVE